MRAWESNCHTTKVDQAKVASWNKTLAKADGHVPSQRSRWLDAIATRTRPDKDRVYSTSWDIKMSQQQLAWSNSVPAGDNGRQPLQQLRQQVCPTNSKPIGVTSNTPMEKQKTMDKNCHCNIVTEALRSRLPKGTVANNNDVELPGVERDQHKLDPTNKFESRQHS